MMDLDHGPIRKKRSVMARKLTRNYFLRFAAAVPGNLSAVLCFRSLTANALQ